MTTSRPQHVVVTHTQAGSGIKEANDPNYPNLVERYIFLDKALIGNVSLSLKQPPECTLSWPLEKNVQIPDMVRESLDLLSQVNDSGGITGEMWFASCYYKQEFGTTINTTPSSDVRDRGSGRTIGSVPGVPR